MKKKQREYTAMENYENEELRQEPEYTPPQPRQEEPQPYR